MSPAGDPNASVSVLTCAPDGVATRIEMRTVSTTTELRDEAVEKYHAIEGGRQTLSNLAAYLTEIARKESRTYGRERAPQRHDVAGQENLKLDQAREPATGTSASQAAAQRSWST